jgi:hypothetical protein
MPALCRASTFFFTQAAWQDVDGRNKPGHDGVLVAFYIRYCLVMISPSRALSEMNS